MKKFSWLRIDGGVLCGTAVSLFGDKPGTATAKKIAIIMKSLLCRHFYFWLKTFIVFCALATAAWGRDVPVTNNSAMVIGTNLTCVLFLDPNPASAAGPGPLCRVRLYNWSRFRMWTLRFPADGLFAVDLMDSSGHSVAKTVFGQKFGRALTQREVNDWFLPLQSAGAGSDPWLMVPPGANQNWADLGEFSLPRVFKLTHAGEYTLHVKMRLIQSCVSNRSGTMRTNVFDRQYLSVSRTQPAIFQSIWLPAVTQKVEILPENISPSN